MSGIRTSVPVITAHVLCSVLAGMAGLLLLARLERRQPDDRLARAATT